jgi:hypothetical protein
MMMSTASDLIERMERETGQRVDDDGSMAMAGLFGALARAMGQSSHRERDDVAAGVVIRHQMTPEYQQEQEGKTLLATMLSAGLSPDDVKSLTE